MPNVERVYYNLLAPAPAVYIDLFKPRKWRNPKTGEEGKERYGAVYLLEENGPDHINLYNIIVGQVQGMTDIAHRGLDTLSIPLENGTVKANKDDGEFFRGKVAFRASSNAFNRDGSPREKVKMYDASTGKFVMIDGDNKAMVDQYFYAGMKCGGSFGFAPFSGMGGGVTAYLNEIYSAGSGERIADRGGDPTARNESFLKYTGRASNLDPRVGMPVVPQSAVAPSAAPRESY